MLMVTREQRCREVSDAPRDSATLGRCAPWIRERACAEAITQAIVEHLNTSPDHTSVVFQEVQRDEWASGGKLMSDSD